MLPSAHGWKRGTLWNVRVPAEITGGTITFVGLGAGIGYGVHVSVGFGGTFDNDIAWSNERYYYQVEVYQKGGFVWYWDSKVYSNQFRISPNVQRQYLNGVDLTFPNLDLDLPSFTITQDGQYYVRVQAVNCCSFFPGGNIFWTDWSTSEPVQLIVASAGPPPPKTNSLSVFAEPSNLEGQNPIPDYDLHASLSVSYTANGNAHSATQPTPFTIPQADIGTQITFVVVGSPPGWSFACKWDDYGQPGQPTSTCESFTVRVHSGSMKVVAFFNPPTPKTEATSVSVWSLDIQYKGQDPSSLTDKDLRAWIAIDEVFNGQHISGSASDTYFETAADVGTPITFSVQTPPNGWTFACLWSINGYQQSTCNSLTFQVTKNAQVVAYFEKTQPQCYGGQYWNGQQCVCPSGQQWNGQQCVTPPNPPTTNECGGGGIVSIGPIFSLFPRTTQTNVYVWAFPLSYLGQDPATQIPQQAEVHATISVTYCSNGNKQQGILVTPFTLSADEGSPITLSVVSPSGFACVWDHYGYRQHQTCTLTINVTNNDKIVAYFNVHPN
jgi:hypothetical protein